MTFSDMAMSSEKLFDYLYAACCALFMLWMCLLIAKEFVA